VAEAIQLAETGDEGMVQCEVLGCQFYLDLFDATFRFRKLAIENENDEHALWEAAKQLLVQLGGPSASIHTVMRFWSRVTKAAEELKKNTAEFTETNS
jgi:hypothetical protein